MANKHGISEEGWLQVGKESNTDHWQRELAHEMSNMQVAWKAREHIIWQDVIDDKVCDMIGYKQVKCHMIFDTSKINLTKKA